jgi:hypothetical protein
MLQYMPLYGSILLTIIIVWIIVHTVRSNRRKIGQAVAGTYIRSTCCGATTTPIGWTEEGWTSLCDECGTWQYLGDDHDNPPPGFNSDGTPISRVLPAPRPSTVRGPADDRQLVSRPTCTCDTLRYVNGDHLPDCPTQRVAYYDVTAGGAEPEVTSEITPYPADCTCHPDDRPAICQRRFAASECVAAYRERYPEIAAMWADEGEPLAVPPPPNIGGEGHPDYQGPHYAVPHDRFVPYDVLRDPLPGAAVHIVGNVACVGPLEVEAGDRGRATLDSSREDEDEL